MSIRIRLLISYLAMLLVPLVLLGIAVIIIGVAVLGDLTSLYKLDTKGQNPLMVILNREANVAADIHTRGAGSPDSLLDPKVAEGLDAKLSEINMGLILRKNDRIVYASDKLNKPELLQHLPSYGAKGEKNFGVRNHRSWLIDRQLDFTYTDGSKGTAFMVADVNFLGRFMRSFSKMFFITLLVILVLTNGILTYFVSRSIIRPLKALKRAADEIREGNLDYVVRPESRDEIGELSMAFEQMRGRLKESVNTQLRYEENRKNLISNISHDLKTPVTSIKGYVEGILDGVTDSPEKMDRYVRTIYTKAVQMDRLIDELFLFSKLDLKRLPFHFEEVDLASFVQDCYEEMQIDVEKRGVALELIPSASSAPAMIAADREKLKRVFVNVIENAVKYMGKQGGVIKLSWKETADSYVVEIADNGQGISEEALPFIFDRFYRADPSRSSAAGGSGLGLAIAQQIVEEHGGTIQAASKQGEGTTVAISLKKRDKRGPR